MKKPYVSFQFYDTSGRTVCTVTQVFTVSPCSHWKCSRILKIRWGDFKKCTQKNFWPGTVWYFGHIGYFWRNLPFLIENDKSANLILRGYFWWKIVIFERKWHNRQFKVFCGNGWIVMLRLVKQVLLWFKIEHTGPSKYIIACHRPQSAPSDVIRWLR